MQDPTDTIAEIPAFLDPDSENLYEGDPDQWGRTRSSDTVDMRGMLKTQLMLTAQIQRKLRVGIDALPPREVKELISSISSILTLAHRTEEILKELDTYKLFMDATIKWLKTRSDGLGEDLVAELRTVASNMKTSKGGSTPVF